MGFWRLFGLIFWAFRLHAKNLPTRGVNANYFGVFRSGLGNINGPEAPSSCYLQFRMKVCQKRLSRCTKLRDYGNKGA